MYDIWSPGPHDRPTGTQGRVVGKYASVQRHSVITTIYSASLSVYRDREHTYRHTAPSSLPLGLKLVIGGHMG
jgi:hypothetical protein